MATTATPNLIRQQYGFASLPVDTTIASGDINTGDLVYMSTNSPPGIASFGSSLSMTAGLVTLLGQRCGVSRDTFPTSGGITTELNAFGVDFAGVFGFKGTSGDTYAQGDEVTIGADAQTVVKTSTLVQAAPTATATSTGGSWSWTGSHTVQVAILTSLGLSMASAATTVTGSSGNVIQVTPAAALPSWAKAFAVFVDGLLAGYQYNNSATNYTGPLTGGNVLPLPKSDALAIGYIDLLAVAPGAVASLAYTAGAPPYTGIAGSGNYSYPVRLYPYINGRYGLN